MKRLSTAMILLLLSLMFTIGGSLAYDNAVYGDNTATSSGIVEQNDVLNAGSMNVNATSHNFTSGQPFTVSNNIKFRTEKWEPGFADAGLIKVKTSVPVTFKIEVDLSESGKDLTELAKVIDVYYTVGDVTAMTSRVEFETSLKLVGSVYDVITNNLIASGSLPAFADHDQTISLVFKMRESAGNQYQGLTLCDSGFTVTATITEDKTTQ